MLKRNKATVCSVNLTVTGTNWTTTNASAMSYQTSSGDWWVSLSIHGTISVAANSVILTIQGLTFSDRYGTNGQALATGIASSAATKSAQADTNASTIKLANSGNTQEWNVSGEVKLKSKPSFLE